MCPHSDNVCRPFQAEAYSLALAELARACPLAAKHAAVIDAVMAGVLDLTAAGQTDPEALARYAASRGRSVFDANALAG
jgi:hypothetical protein